LHLFIWRIQVIQKSLDIKDMALFNVWKIFPFRTAILKQYFMCHRVWKEAMPYRVVEIEPEHKYRWNWRIKDKINFILFQWNFEHSFTSIQKEHEDYLSISFENSNQVSKFSARILYEQVAENPLKIKVSLVVDELELKDRFLNTIRIAFLDLIKTDYTKFLTNVYNMLQQPEKRLEVLEDCSWTDFAVVKF